MNISSSTNAIHKLPFPRQTTSPEAAPENAAQTVIKQRNPNEEFYRYEDSPWLIKNSKGEIDSFYNTLPKADLDLLRNEYLKDLIITTNTEMCRMFDNYHEFKQQLPYLNLELSKKHFGFTLGFNQEIQVTDPDGVLTPAEFSYLTEKLNERQSLKDDLRKNAKSVMELVDQYTEKLDNRHTLNLENYSKIVDYGQIFSRNHIGNFINTILYQVERNAPKREEARQAVVDVHA
ncbi:hypothetical protein [Pseudomonas syringae]|nr:hypothetical protein [Pseudomonas syringae]MCF5469453.1 hypothetical protein [Pseudomonas syringae]MCF5475179.1 hypothetical protein [Pseudomonas syringae]MCF5484705.1 hypothetical protein [Pseudomonas syringae]MCF5495922.1 hypothetical protein [Pseudomonas syringae]MCF5500613.1 hypothetical protein [Pseudomonas syringae]